MLENREENTGRIYVTPADSVNGSFIYPRVFGERFRETSSVNISWKTQYDAVNLYTYQRGKVGASVQLSTNLAARWFQWEVRVQETNLTEPYVFRVVNAFGTPEEQLQHGFWSSSFFVNRDVVSGSTPASTITPSSSSTHSVSSTPSLPSIESPTASSPPTTTGGSLTGTSEAPTGESGAASLGAGAIAGIAIGSVACAVILGLIAFWCGPRKGSKSKQAAPTYVAHQENDRKPEEGGPKPLAAELYVHPVEMQVGGPIYYEPYLVI